MGASPLGQSPHTATMSLFNSNTLSTAWTLRSGELKAQRLQAHNDMLYDHLRRDFLLRNAALQESLVEAIRTASSKEDLTVPLWTYNSTYIANAYQERRREPVSFGDFEGWLREKGYEWSIGKVRPGFNPETIETIAWEWEWDRAPATVYEVVSKTDLLDRLALLFGDTFLVTRRVVATKSILKPFEAQVYRTELRLHYYPRGLPTAIRDRQATARAKYADYGAPVSEDHIHLWVGVPSEVEPFVPPAAAAEPAGFSNLPPSRASTPPPPLLAAEPPRLPSRTNGGGIRPPWEDEDESPCRRLDYSAACPCCTGVSEW